MPGKDFWDAKAPRSKDPLEMIVGIADCWEDNVELVGALLQFDNDLLLKFLLVFLAALASSCIYFSRRRSFQQARVVYTP